jgi:hypothetical protein
MLGKLLKRLVEEKQTRIGKVDMELALQLKENKERHEKLHEEMESKIKEFIEQLENEHRPVCDQFMAEKSDIWEKIYDQLGLSQAERDENYRISHVTGIVHKVEELPAFDIGDEDEQGGPIH